MLLFYSQKGEGGRKKKILQAAPQASPWGLTETRWKNKEQKQKGAGKKMLLLHNIKPKRDKLMRVL